jgi:peptidoglycan/LPS O-acetylase OafA/YrhL
MAPEKPTQKSPPDFRLRELDALRGIAATMVMWFHYTVQYQETYHRPVIAASALPAGRYGVQLFFVISGFVIFLTLTRSRSLWDFAANRFSRLYPPYWACIAITFVTLLACPLPGFDVSVRQVLVNLTMLQYWLFTEHIDPVYWTLSVELVFYCFVSCLYLVGWLKHVERWISFWLMLAIGVRFTDITAVFHLSPMIRTALLLEHGHFFFAGVLFYRVRQDGGSIFRWFLLSTCIFAAWFIRDVPHALSLVAASLAFAAFIRGWLGWLVIKPLLFLGNISYPLYLLHQNIGYVVIDRLEMVGLTHEVWLLVPAAVSVAIATVVHRTVEIPARDWLRGFWKNSRLRRKLVRA